MEGRILVVHRNELILDVVQEMLQNVGYAVTLATDGHRALSKAMAGRFSLIIIDRNLDGEFDGIRLVELLRKYGVRTPILGTAPDADWDGPNLEQIDELLSSPFEYGDLVKAVSALLDDGPLPQAQTEASLPGLPELPDPPDLPEPDPAASTSVPSSNEVEPPKGLVARPILPSTRTVRPWEPRRIERREGPARILVVDTADDSRALLVGTLEGRGYEVTGCASGDEAYDHAMLHDYELIILDLWTRGMDGFEVLEAIRKSGVDTAAVVLTGYVTREMVRELLPWKIRKILLKPAKTDLLLSTVAEIVPR